MAQAQEAISEGSQERQKVTLDEKKQSSNSGATFSMFCEGIRFVKTLEVLEGKLRLKASTHTKIQLHTSRDFLRESCKT